MFESKRDFSFSKRVLGIMKQHVNSSEVQWRGLTLLYWLTNNDPAMQRELVLRTSAAEVVLTSLFTHPKNKFVAQKALLCICAFAYANGSTNGQYLVNLGAMQATIDALETHSDQPLVQEYVLFFSFFFIVS